MPQSLTRACVPVKGEDLKQSFKLITQNLLMEDILRRIKLVDDTSISLNLTRQEFISELRNNVEEANIDNIFSETFEIFSSNKKKYKGLVDSRGFYIRKKRKLFEKNRGRIKAKGSFKTNGDILVINTTISAFSLKLLFTFFIFICYITFIFYPQSNTISFKDILNNIPIPFFLFLLVILVFMWFSLKKEVAKMKQDLEKYFHLITSKLKNVN